MLINKILFPEQVSRFDQLQAMGFPVAQKRVSGYDSSWLEIIYSDESLSTFTKERLDLLRKSVPNFGALWGRSLIVGLVLFFAGLFYAIAVDSLSLIVIAAVIGYCVAEAEAYLVVVRLKAFARYQTDEVKAAVQQIVDEDTADQQLAHNITDWARSVTEQLVLEKQKVGCDSSFEVPPNGNESWRVTAVQFHAGVSKENPASREATITFTSTGEDALVCVLPSSEAITSWLRQRLDDLMDTVHEGTHTYERLKSLSPRKLLEPLWSEPSRVLRHVGELQAELERPLTERSRVAIYGEHQPGGQLLVQGMQIEATPLIMAPTGTFNQVMEAVQDKMLANDTYRRLAA